MYVIRRIPDGAFVAPSGRKASYARSLQHARIFPTRESAERDRCPENERVYAVSDLLEAKGKWL